MERTEITTVSGKTAFFKTNDPSSPVVPYARMSCNPTECNITVAATMGLRLLLSSTFPLISVCAKQDIPNRKKVKVTMARFI